MNGKTEFPDSEGRTSAFRLICRLLGVVATAALLIPTVAGARETRLYQSSFGSFPAAGHDTPGNIAVDYETGDVYVVSPASGGVRRFDDAGAAKNFPELPGPGTNELPVGGSVADIAVDNSGGPLDGSIYVANGRDAVEVFDRDGASLGSLTGSATPEGLLASPCGVTVDQQSGDVFIAEHRLPGGGVPGADTGAIRRYVPNSPSGSLGDEDFTVTGASTNRSCGIAANDGSVFALLYINTHPDDRKVVRRFDADDLAATTQALAGELFAGNQQALGIDVDPETGDLYINHGTRVRVVDPHGETLYQFGGAGYFGLESAGIAVGAADSGPAERVYVSDSTSRRQVDVFGPPDLEPTYTRNTITSFGPDGTAASQFTSGLHSLAFDQGAGRLFALDKFRDSPTTEPTVLLGFDASSHDPVTGFDPLTTGVAGGLPGLAIDSTGSVSDGNVYVASRATNLVYGYDADGSPLGAPFPLDPTVDPGGSNGSPADLCGAAVDSTGVLWVSNAATDRILPFSSAGVALSGAIDLSSPGKPCQLAFDSDDDLYVTANGGVWKLTAASGYTSASQVAGRSSGYGDGSIAIAVDVSNDHLYVAQQGAARFSDSPRSWINELDSDGTVIDEFTVQGAEQLAPVGITTDSTSGHVYVADRTAGSRRIHELGPRLLLPEVAARQPSAIANTTATLNGTVNTQDVPLASCAFEYVSEAAYRVSRFSDLSSGGSVACNPPAASIPVDLTADPVSAPATGLTRNTDYRFRLVAANADGEIATADVAFRTAGPPAVETAGSPVRTATTAQLQGRVLPQGAQTEFYFEYGTDGPCSANPCEVTSPSSAGAGKQVRFVAAEIDSLEPDMTYYYRVTADNGNPDGRSFGSDRELTTRSDDDPLTHGSFPGPPGSDRAWEMVSMRATSGNHVSSALGIADNGDRAAYQLGGGSPGSEVGSFTHQAFAERTEDGWAQRTIHPKRDVSASFWLPLSGAPDLSRMIALSSDEVIGSTIWSLFPDTPPAQLTQFPQDRLGGFLTASTNGSRVAVAVSGTVDPAYPVADSSTQLYALDSNGGDPALVSLQENGQPSGCEGVVVSASGPLGLPQGTASVTSPSYGWVTGDGSRVVFASRAGSCESDGTIQLYERNLIEDQTRRVSPEAVGGEDCSAAFIKGTSDAAFFWSRARLSDEDTDLQGCGRGTTQHASQGGDVYRYAYADGEVECLTCLVPGLDADVPIAQGVSGGRTSVAVAADGSRVYFVATSSLLSGAPENGIYRLEVATGELAYIAPAAGSAATGDLGSSGNALTPDGKVYVFVSRNQALNQVGGTRNGGKDQMYRYDDSDRSLACISCPVDGQVPSGSADSSQLTGAAATQVGPNLSLVSRHGDVVFATGTSLVADDGNAGGPGEDENIGRDVYEWRDGRQILVTDGETKWPPGLVGTSVGGITPSGNDVFFLAGAKLTPDAGSSTGRLYDARIGGGFTYDDESVEPCQGDACQGSPASPPTESAPGTVNRGEGNPPPPARPLCKRPHKRVRKAKAKVRAAKTRKKRARARAGLKVAKRDLARCRQGR